MKKTNLSVWIVRFIFCLCVILAFKTVDNLNDIVGWFGWVIGILTPFVIGGSIAFFLFPVCRKTESLLRKTNKPFIVAHVRGIATCLIVLLAVLLLSAALSLVVPMLYQSIASFITSIPSYLQQMMSFLHSHFGDAPWIQQMADAIQNTISLESMAWLFRSMDFNSYVGGITSVFMSLFNVLIGSIIAIYLLLDRASIKKILLRIGTVTIREKHTRRVENLSSRIATVIYTFIFGQVLDALLIATCIGLLLTLFGVPNSIVLAMIYFIFALIPYFGSIVGVIVVALFSLVSGNLQHCLIAAVISLVMQQLDTNLINPKVVGHAVGIRPLYVILGITLFGGMFGIAGVFLGPPLMAIIIELLNDVLQNKETKLTRLKRSNNSKGLFEQIKESVEGSSDPTSKSNSDEPCPKADGSSGDQSNDSPSSAR